jgi:hypothetical protein
MARLFVSQRELNYISDITKEIIKDVIGQKVYYYPISEKKSRTHGVYGESLQKVFENPIILDALVDTNFQTETKIDQFGIDTQFRLEVFVQYRDILEKGIQISIGDVFSFSDIFYEVSDVTFNRYIYGMPDHLDGMKMVGTRIRKSQFDTFAIGPTDIAHSDDDAVQTMFQQQRGEAYNVDGETGDVRDLVKNEVLEKPLEGQRQVSLREDNSKTGSSFYDE